jgi:hypothetical protein
MLRFSKPMPQANSDAPPMKQVIEGKAYNTATSKLIHEHSVDYDENQHNFGPEYPYTEQLFRTRFGKFFLVVHNEAYNNPAIDDIDLRNRIVPLETDHAVKWMEKHCNDKITDYVDVPEAGEPSTTLTLRLDKVLKISLNAAAIQEGVSMNQWCVRALEAAVAQHEHQIDA